MGNYTYVDSAKSTNLNNPDLATSSGVADQDITFFRQNYYIVVDTGNKIRAHRPVASQVTDITPSLAANTAIKGITNDRRYLVCTIFDSLAVNADKIAKFDIRGNKISEVSVSDGAINRYEHIVFNRNRLYCLDRNVPKVAVFAMNGTLIKTFNLTAGKRYAGITIDRKNLWLTRADTSESASGSIECWSTDGTQLKNMAAPLPTAAFITFGITYNRRYKVVQYNFPPPLDVA